MSTMAICKGDNRTRFHPQEQTRKINTLWLMPLLNEFFSLCPQLVFVDVLFRRLIILLMNNYFWHCYIARLPRQWRITSSKRIKRRIRRIRNWKRQRKRKRQRQQKKIVQRQQDGWDSISTDGWIQPNGEKIGKLFEQVCHACPDFYDIGIRTDFLQTMLGTDKMNGFFLRELHDWYIVIWQ